MSEQNVQNPMTEQEYSQVVKIRREKLDELKAQGCDPFEQVRFSRTHHSADIAGQYDTLEGETVAVAGRLMAKRIMGKASFGHVLDAVGSIQIYLRRDELPEGQYDAFKKMDIGDLVGVSGRVFKTRTGEVSLHVTQIELLAKSLLPLPEKFHGLKDPDLRYRQRYVDLIVNPEVRDTFKMRSAILREIRRYMDDRGYLEVETPVLHDHATNSNARPFKTHHNTLDMDMYLRVETELALKRLIVGGLEKVYEIGRIFRNEGMDTRHNPEFTTIEMYEAYTDYKGMMDLAEGLFVHIGQTLCGTLEIPYQGRLIDLTPPWNRMTMAEAVKQYAGVDMLTVEGDEAARALAREKGVPVREDDTWGEVLNAFFEEKVEENLVQPTFIYDYPVEVSPLAKRKKEDPRLTERFEFFMNCQEMGNAFSELNDPIDQRERFVRQAIAKHGENADFEIDEDFVTALEYGMPPTGGMGIGVDRMVMLFTDAPSIRDVLLFPTMRPRDKNQAPRKAERAPASHAQDAPAEAVSVSAASVQIDLSKVKIEPLFEESVDFDTFAKSDFRVVKVEACEAVTKSKKLLRFTLDDGTDRKRTILSGIHEYYEPEELVGKTCVAITNLPPRKMMGIESEGMLISAVYEYDGREGLQLLMLDDAIPAGAKLY